VRRRAEKEAERACPDTLFRALAAIAIHRVFEGDRDPEEIGTNVDARPADTRVCRVHGENDAGEEDVRLNPASEEIEVEVVDTSERHDRELEPGVVMDPSHHEEPGGVESLFDHALVAPLLEIAHSGFRFADHPGVGCGNACQ
jgi:hypothetical protein